LNELSHSYDQGKPIRPEDILARWPMEPAGDADVASLLFEDYLQQRRRGADPQLSDYQQRFPQQQDSLRSLVRQNDILHSLGVSRPSGFTLRLPDVGDEVFGFRLHHELGRGAFARVFLGEQIELAGRPVVLKVAASDNAEPHTLAQLQHTNIVPIYSAHEDTKAGVRLVCMPYFGGASLSVVLRHLTAQTKQPQHGSQLVAALRAVEAPTLEAVKTPCTAAPLIPLERGQATLARFERLSYVQVAAWITARLAQGLHHAHQRGIYHRDIKPSNILLCADGEPMLLDFNLAASASDSQAKATVGGTVAYMAPEHLRAMASRNPVLARHVDQRADIYALGMVLYEMLVGERPFEQSASYAPLPALIEAMAVERSQGTPSLRASRPDVPWGLESIVRKCLAPDPALRYQRADHLAEDLDALLDDRPLRHAPELSRVERGRKWLRRHPRVASAGAIGTVAAVLLASAGLLLVGMRDNLYATQQQRDDALIIQRDKQFADGALKALCLVNTTTDLPQHDHLRQGIAACEEALRLYDILERDDWQESELWARRPSLDRSEHTRELLLLLARARVGQAPDDPAVLQDALRLLDKAESLRGLAPTRALLEDRADYLTKLGDVKAAQAARQRAEALQPATARDHYLLATALVRRQGPHCAAALAALDQAVNLNPKHYWAHVQRGVLHLQCDRPALAAGDFGKAAGLWPENALAYFNLGCALLRAGQPEEAAQQFAHALTRDPDFVLAWLNRGLVRLELAQHAPALEDFVQAATRGCDQAAVWAGRGVALEKLQQPAEADAAFKEAFARAAGETEAAQTRLRWVYGFAVCERLPAEAARMFDEVLQRQPEHPQALYGRAMLAAQEEQIDQALHYFDRALAAQPSFVEARRFRAVLLARRGRLADAAKEINACLIQEPRSGPTLYAAGCVAAWAVEQGDAAGAAVAVEQALQFLERAVAAGYGRDKIATDPDLAALRRLPAYERWLVQDQK
jgi:serine/threonine protein kinase/Tfp pilus assembly protein PilF